MMPVRSARGTGALRARLGLASSGQAVSDDLIVTELYRQYHRSLLSFVLRLTAGDRQQAEDVVQDGPGLAAGWPPRSRRGIAHALAGHRGPAYRD